MTASDGVIVAAVDLGATSGRVMLGRVGRHELELRQVSRFGNGPVRLGESLHWDAVGLYQRTLNGLREAVRAEPTASRVAIDSWAVDYGLLRGGRLTGVPRHYRDAPNAEAMAGVHARFEPGELYARNGLQEISISTIYQLAVDLDRGELAHADRLLLIPDLFAAWLSGVEVAERTNASTTGLLGVHDQEWDEEILDRLGYPRGLLPELVDPGTELGALRGEVADAVGAHLVVATVGSHDTASAVAAVPADGPDFAYISCGTWALVGVETAHPIVSDAGRAANFTNERGVDGRIRFLRNVTGLWLLSEAARAWGLEGEPVDPAALVAAAAAAPAPEQLLDPDAPEFARPGDDMPERIAAWYRDRGLRAPSTRAQIARAVIESLAAAFAAAVAEAESLSGVSARAIHLVGGGSLNTLLCQLTADYSARPVVAGPAEATAVGNVLLQGRAAGAIAGDLDVLRARVRSSMPPLTYPPRVRD